jgi:hypothetical protein
MRIMYYARDSIINNILTSYGMTNALLLYNTVTATPQQIILGIIASKFSLSKTAVALIIIFLL